MSWDKRVVWTEGMMLQPHHFQQQTRYHEAQLRQSVSALTPFYCGFSALEIDEQLLKTGRFHINVACGMFDDASAFTIPHIDSAPKAINIGQSELNATIYLAVPHQHQGSQDFYRDAQPGGRYLLSEQQIRDVSTAKNEASFIEVTGLKVSLRTSLQDNSEFSCLAIAQVDDVSPNGAVSLKHEMIPPLLNVKVSRTLTKFCSELIQLMEYRVTSLASRVSVVGQSTGSEIVDYMMLQTLNRHLPLLINLDSEECATPFYVYEKFVSLIGDMSTLLNADKKIVPLPVYQHQSLTDVFTPIIEQIRQLLSVVLEQNSVAITLKKKKFGIHVGAIADRSLLTSAGFILAVGADASMEDIRRYFPSQVKIGSVETIKELVNLQLPGIKVKQLSAAPREVPYNRHYAYFELVAEGEDWTALCQSGGIAVHISDYFANLSLELWAIRN